jgi:hypothetical protein
MNANAVGIIVSAIVTVAAVIITHILNQRKGEERASQVRNELMDRFELFDKRLTEARDGLSGRIVEVKGDLSAMKNDLSTRISEHRAQTDSQSALIRTEIRAEIVSNTAGMKEVMSSEMRALKAEILAALPQRSQQAGHQ